MDFNLLEKWDLSQHKLPYSSIVNISSLAGVFRSTAASYKFLFFLSLLNILDETHYNKLKISLDDILLEMLSIAWFPHNFFKLNFGINDRIAQELDRLSITDSQIRVSNTKNSKNEVKAVISRKDFTNNNLLALVPYRLLSPFFLQDLKGLKDAKRNRAISELASSRFDEIKPFYLFSDDHKSIIMNPNWILYFAENQAVLRSFINWNWLEYMQKRNPTVPNLQLKLFPPTKRVNLNAQTDYWRTILKYEKMRCIFSGQVLTTDDLSIDHFLPWSFVAHDQLWNLIPVSRSVNSSKSNNLPSLDEYLVKFAEMQFLGLRSYNRNPGKMSWNKIVESYVYDLKMKSDEILDRDKLEIGLRSAIVPLNSLAASQGFSEGWVYTERSA